MRTKQIKYSIAALVASVTVTTSCSRFEEMNINRNAVQNTTATTFVQPTVFNYEYRMINRSFTLTSQLMQYTVGHQQNADKISNYRIQNSVAAGYWNDFYSVGGNAQAMLEQAKKDKNDAALAVASIIKVIAMSTLTDAYGDVPYYDHVLGSTDADVYKARDDRGYVMDRVLEDFDFAARNLPGTWESGNTRVTKWAALAYASRAALYEGTFRKYHGMADADKYLRQAAATAKEFITDSPFYLYEEGAEPYRELFYSENAKTCEVVLCRRYDKAFGISHSVPYNIKFGRTSLTRRFMNHYLMADGSRFTDKEGWETMPYSEETQGRDPRMAQTVLCPGYKQVEATTVTRNTLSSHTGYEPIKFVGTAANSTTSGAASSDWILMRAAEVYLNYAEAVAELGTITQNDLEISVNLIRKRAKMTGIDLTKADASPDPYLLECYPNVTKSAHTGVILEIRRERTVELVMEPPYRSWDLFRWNECKQALNHYRPYYGCYIAGAGTYDMDNDGTPDLELYIDEATSSCPTKLQIGKEVILSEETKGYIVGYPGVVHGRNWDDARDYLWPIPAAQRTLNPALTQNPGWDDGLNF